MKRFFSALTLTCVISVPVLAGDIPTVGVTTPGDVPTVGVTGDVPSVGVTGDIPSVGITGDIPSGGFTFQIAGSTLNLIQMLLGVGM